MWTHKAAIYLLKVVECLCPSALPVLGNDVQTFFFQNNFSNEFFFFSSVPELEKNKLRKKIDVR